MRATPTSLESTTPRSLSVNQTFFSFFKMSEKKRVRPSTAPASPERKRCIHYPPRYDVYGKRIPRGRGSGLRSIPAKRESSDLVDPYHRFFAVPSFKTSQHRGANIESAVVTSTIPNVASKKGRQSLVPVKDVQTLQRSYRKQEGKKKKMRPRSACATRRELLAMRRRAREEAYWNYAQVPLSTAYPKTDQVIKGRPLAPGFDYVASPRSKTLKDLVHLRVEESVEKLSKAYGPRRAAPPRPTNAQTQRPESAPGCRDRFPARRKRREPAVHPANERTRTPREIKTLMQSKKTLRGNITTLRANTFAASRLAPDDRRVLRRFTDVVLEWKNDGRDPEMAPLGKTKDWPLDHQPLYSSFQPDKVFRDFSAQRKMIGRERARKRRDQREKEKRSKGMYTVDPARCSSRQRQRSARKVQRQQTWRTSRPETH